MKVTERAALIDRLARALLWTEQPEPVRALARERAVEVIDEIEQGHRDHDEIAWMLLDDTKVE